MKKEFLIAMLVLLFILLIPIHAWAHFFWINSYDSNSHAPGHVLVTLGYGHSIPMDDLLDSKGARLSLESYELVDPALQRSPLRLPVPNEIPEKKTDSGVIVSEGDLGIAKLAFTEETTNGTFQVGAVSEPDYYTLFENEKGRRKWEIKPMDEVTGAKKIIQSCKYQAMAKTFFAHQKWTQPKALGHTLEIIPMTDLSAVTAGDLVEFKIIFMNEPFSSLPSQIERITAVSNTYGGPDNFYLAANIYGGKAAIRIPTAGQWVATVYYVQDISQNERLAPLATKCRQVHYVASISFNVKPG